MPSTGWIIQIKQAVGRHRRRRARRATSTATVQNSTDVRLNWTAATDNVGITEYRVHRSATTGFTPSAANRIATVSGSTLTYTDPGRPTGTWYYQVVAADAAGNAGASSLEENATIVPDTTPPTVSVTAPAAGATVTRRHRLADRQRGRQPRRRVACSSRSTAPTSAARTRRRRTRVTWDSRTVCDGPHSVTAVATDTASLATTSAAVPITVNNAPAPDTTGADGPERPDGDRHDEPVQLAWTAATDNVAVVRYNVHREHDGRLHAVRRQPDRAAGDHRRTPIPGSPAGDYYYRVTAEDAAGNVGPATAEVKGTVDATAPVVAITAPTGGTVSGTISVTANATDAVGVSGVQFRLDGAVLGSRGHVEPVLGVVEHRPRRRTAATP